MWPPLIARDLSRRGFAVLDDLVEDDARQLVATLGASALRVTGLEARAKSESSVYSLSGRFGRGVFPLHTDGAHTLRPPDLVGLWSRGASEIATLVADGLDPALGVPSLRDSWVVEPRGGRASFYAIPWRIRGTHSRLRLNVACMYHRRTGGIPSDVREALSAVPRQRVVWRPGRLLLINNKRMLHGREALPESESRSLLRFEVFL